MIQYDILSLGFKYVVVTVFKLAVLLCRDFTLGSIYKKVFLEDAYELFVFKVNPNKQLKNLD